MRRVSPRRVEELLGGFHAHLEADAPAPRIDRDDAAAITDVLHDQMDRGVAAREAVVVEQGRTVACQRGCAWCCEQVLVVREAEAVTVARWLAHPDRAVQRARFLAAYPRWRTSGGALLASIATAAAADQPALNTLQFRAYQNHLMCPFNHEGACDVYPARPNLCRNAYAVDTAERCRVEQRATVLDGFVAMDDFLARIRPLEQAMQESLGAPPAPARVMLADRVHALLAEAGPATGRNDPCPCGSGKKYKRCCGA